MVDKKKRDGPGREGEQVMFYQWLSQNPREEPFSARSFYPCFPGENVPFDSKTGEVRRRPRRPARGSDRATHGSAHRSATPYRRIAPALAAPGEPSRPPPPCHLGPGAGPANSPPNLSPAPGRSDAFVPGDDSTRLLEAAQQPSSQCAVAAHAELPVPTAGQPLPSDLHITSQTETVDPQLVYNTVYRWPEELSQDRMMAATTSSAPSGHVEDQHNAGVRPTAQQHDFDITDYAPPTSQSNSPGEYGNNIEDIFVTHPDSDGGKEQIDSGHKFDHFDYWQSGDSPP